MSGHGAWVGCSRSRFIMRVATNFMDESGAIWACRANRFVLRPLLQFQSIASFMSPGRTSRGRFSFFDKLTECGLGRTHDHCLRQIESLTEFIRRHCRRVCGRTAGERDSPGLLTPRHPSQLYEAFFEGIVLFRDPLGSPDAMRHQRSFSPALFFICYASFRIIVEIFANRMPPDRRFHSRTVLFVSSWIVDCFPPL